MNDSEVLAFVERWASTYWHVEPVRMSIVGCPGRRSNDYEVEVVLWQLAECFGQMSRAFRDGYYPQDRGIVTGTQCDQGR
jgi:hypothetical protein